GVMGGDEVGACRRRGRGDGPGGDVDTEAAEQRRALPEAQPQPVVQPRSPGHGPGPDLGRSRPQGVGDLLGVAPLDPAPTSPTAANTHPELRDDRSYLGQLGLELLGPALEIDPLAAVRAAL